LIYLDTSVVAPFYWQEQLSAVVQELLGNESEVAFDTPLRTLDALHLAIASSQGIGLITADRGLAGSAEAFGIEVQLLALPEST
jgi:predicted nucleic acid-binding protein